MTHRHRLPRILIHNPGDIVNDDERSMRDRLARTQARWRTSSAFP